MDLRQLEVFVRIAERGSYTRAALDLDASQPAISRQIRALEVELGSNIFQRTGRGVVLTEAGNVLLDHARGILHQVSRARDDVDRVRGAVTGRVALGMPPTQARLLSVSIMREFGQRFPHAHLSISEGLSSRIQEWVKQGQLDIALIYNPTVTRGLDLTHLMTEPLYFVAARGWDFERAQIVTAKKTETISRARRHVSLETLAKSPLIIPTRPNAIRVQVDSTLAAKGLQPKIQMEIDAISAILELVAAGAGAAVLPRSSVSAFGRPQDLTLTPIKIGVDDLLHVDLYIASSNERPNGLTMRGVVDIVRSLVSKL